MEYNNIVSLGKDCMPRALTTKYKLKKKKSSGELSLPFDLAIHRYDAVCGLIENNFQDYTNPALFTVAEDGVIEHSKYFVRYTHEQDMSFYENEFARLIEVYARRINNFYKYIEADNVLFISTFPVYPKELCSVLKDTFPRLNFKLLNFDARPVSSNFYRSPDLNENIENIIYVRAPVPSKEYIWWKKEFYELPEGKEFENYFSYVTNLVLGFGLSSKKVL